MRNAASDGETGIIRARSAFSPGELMTKQRLLKVLTTSLVRKERRMFEMLLAPSASNIQYNLSRSLYLKLRVPLTWWS